ncbi:MAG TPA: response regulator transcription factor [Steroidobacteraceae bacterium]
MQDSFSVLLIEDDPVLARSLLDFLRSRGYPTDHCPDGRSGLGRARERGHGVIILDRMLPELDGLELVRTLRREAIAAPVIFLTTMDGIDDRVQGLEAGGDDYLVKPFAFEELLARVRVLARRSRGLSAIARAGAVELDVVARSATREGRPVELLPQEYRLLEYLVRHANSVVTRRMLLEHVWDIHFDPHTSVVESHISRLRSKLNLGFDTDLIQTVRGIGYKLLAPQ